MLSKYNKRSVLRRQSTDTNRNVRLYYPYWQYTDLFIFRFVVKIHVHAVYCISLYIDVHASKQFVNINFGTRLHCMQ